MTPGAYLRLRRLAAGRSLDEVGLMTATDPAICARDRAAIVADIEADRIPVSANIVVALHEVFAFDRAVLLELVRRHADPDAAASPGPEICRRCGCSWHDPCLDEAGAGCAWADPARALCTACAGGPVRVVRLRDRSAWAAPDGAGAVAADVLRAMRFAGHARC